MMVDVCRWCCGDVSIRNKVGRRCYKLYIDPAVKLNKGTVIYTDNSANRSSNSVIQVVQLVYHAM
jgi:hypothetical protein